MLEIHIVDAWQMQHGDVSKGGYKMILPANTYLYRYCVGVEPPQEWSADFENPEYSNLPSGKKNQIGAFFFYTNEETARNVAGCALANYGQKYSINYYTITSCQTTRDLNLLDLRGNLKPYVFLEELYNQGIDILTDDFVNYFKGGQLFSIQRDNFMQLVNQIAPFSQENPHWHQNCQLAGELWMFFSCGNNDHILGQLVTDFANGRAFKQILQSKMFDGYIFNEEKDCPTICIFDSSNLSSPNHIEIN